MKANKLFVPVFRATDRSYLRFGIWICICLLMDRFLFMTVPFLPGTITDSLVYKNGKSGSFITIPSLKMKLPPFPHHPFFDYNEACVFIKLTFKIGTTFTQGDIVYSIVICVLWFSRCFSTAQKYLWMSFEDDLYFRISTVAFDKAMILLGDHYGKQLG